MPAKFIIYRTRSGQFYFTFESTHQEILLTSASFIFRASCSRTIDSLRLASAHDYNYQHGTGTNGDHFFVVRGPDLNILATSVFFSEMTALAAARAIIKEQATIAELIDEW